MIYRVRHTTRYAYGSTVDLAAHMLHLRPRDLPHQRVISAAVATAPGPSHRRDGLDHFGNHVTWLFIDAPHASFEVTAEAEVEVRTPDPPAAGATPGWERVRDMARAGGPGAWQAAEFRFDSPMCAAVPAAGDYAAASFPAGRPVLAGLLDLNARIRRDFRFQAGVTDLSTPVAEVLRRREGVCQDFTHLMISGLRALGLPARYMSGYIRTRPPPGQPRRRGADQSHAWVGAWLGPEHGWVELDPTNDVLVRDEHVVLGWGRDYGDISPVRGVMLGGGDHGLAIGVDLEPLDEAATAAG
ncbi:transglutaminase family protein [Paracraurococcus lichenis]|uniref:Transglutaminase family protein n=1 Tax=Paracraurococcus lichenis TaxID=3064888 RepID=A0ABT9E0I7_9PROT|nr:transglutaminase family protein [Paracraurococcus sp. LOR1-02]MDO9709654.1 transglutaminase family protein [Paracraurococcus sp. LOR1-02]